MHLGIYYRSSCHHLSMSHLAQYLSLNFLCPPSDWTSYRERLYGSKTRWNLIQLFSKVILEMQRAKKGCCENCLQNLHVMPCVCSKNYGEDEMGNIQHKNILRLIYEAQEHIWLLKFLPFLWFLRFQENSNLSGYKFMLSWQTMTSYVNERRFWFSC